MNKSELPKTGLALLMLMLRTSDKEHVIGSFEVEYLEIYSKKGRLSSKIWFWEQILLSLLPLLKVQLSWGIVMFGNYIKTALRNIKTQKTYSMINITGLAAGMACCILILVWVFYEFSYDRFHKNQDRIYRLVSDYQSGSRLLGMSYTPLPLGETLKNNYPDVLESSRCMFFRMNRLESGQSVYYNTTFGYVDPSFFNIFTFPLLKGDPAKALKDKYSVVITEKIAQKLFADEDPAGKNVLLFEDKIPFTVSAVIENPPKNSHIQFDILMNTEISNDRRKKYNLKPWVTNTVNYILVKEDFNKKELENKITTVIKSHNVSKYKKIYLQPLTDIHLRSGLNGDTPNFDKGDINGVILFLSVSIIVLFIACINFMCLSTASYIKRSKEVGIRKVCGASRKDLIKQFLGESLIFTFIALFFALILVNIFLPVLKQLSGKELDFNLVSHGYFALAVLIITIGTGFLAGSYPALFLSSFRPEVILKSRFLSGKKSRLNLRNSLVAVQFIFAILLITVTSVIYFQIDYIDNKDLGYDKEDIITVYPPYKDVNRDAFREELLKNPNIKNVSSGFLPIRGNYGHEARKINWEGKDPESKPEIHWFPAYYDYLETFGIKLAGGRFFSREYPADKNNYVINESAVKIMGMENPVGRRFSLNGKEGRIIGIIKDFHISSLRVGLEPFVFQFNDGYWFIIKAGRLNQPETIKYIEKVWGKFLPDRPFEYRFLEDDINKMYRQEFKTGTILRYFTFLTLFVFFLGLIGLVSFSTEQKTKEIGIRKVLGANITGIAALIIKEFTLLFIIAFILSCPAGFYFMREWLSNFVYKIDLSWWIFAASGIITMVLCLLTVSFQTIKAARKNPVDSLKCE